METIFHISGQCLVAMTMCEDDTQSQGCRFVLEILQIEVREERIWEILFLSQ